jgi:protease I
MDLSAKKVAIVVHDYFEQAEFTQPLQALKDAGAEVHVISASGEQRVRGLNHVDKGDTFQADLLIDAANPEDYDALVLPGGAVNADNLRMVPTARSWTSSFMSAGKPVAAICHAPWVLASSGVVNGKKLTSFFTIQDDLRNAGADWVDEEVVVDDNLITSRNPDDLPAFCSALIGALQ